ncbi:MAG: hypothetical protein GXO10_02990 [Crenarchaeota archaeon]|nr:hypothetical protein [Thermoproteota archaeon]
MSVVSYCSVARGQDFLPAVDFGTSLRVIDGDTLMVSLHYRGDIVVRFAVIDAFETYKNRHIKIQEEVTGLNATAIVKRGLEAKHIVQSLLPPNTPIVVVLGDHRYGYYGRLIATVYIFRNNKWINLNEYLLTKYPNLFLETDIERRQVK